MRKTSTLAALMSLTFLAAGLQAADSFDQAWLDFRNALGEPALIGANADHDLARTAYRPIQAFAADELNPAKLRLGFDLFHERRLSVDNSIGCNSCHSGMFGGTDGRKVSTGVNGVLGNLNSPTTFNAAMNFRQFWDGRAVTLTDQALGPIENALEMAHDISAVVEILKSDSSYPAGFAEVYPDGITSHNIADALAYFQTVNFTRASTPFVRHLNGEEAQLSEQALRGWERFDEVGCASCHNGINLGGNSYQQLGAFSSYFVEHRTAGPNDNGLINRSGRDSDLHVFKVPTLHGVAETAPYFHDGSIETLELAIEEMGEHQLGRQLSEQDVDDIAAFLRSLGGRMMGMMGGMGQGMMGGGMNMGQGMSQGQGGGRGMGQPMGQGMGRGMGMRQGGAAAQQGAASVSQTASQTAWQGSHETQFGLAIAAAESAKEKLISEMALIDSGTVANFDFLQFEHLELIRHARALHYPPANLSAADRAALVELAEQLLAETQQLEWVISDFLRAWAMVDILGTYSAIPEQARLAGDMGDAAAALMGQREKTQTAMGAMRASNVNFTAAQLLAKYQSAL